MAWDDEDIKSTTGKIIIDIHRLFNIPLFYLNPEELPQQNLEYHAVFSKNNVLSAWVWIDEENRRIRLEEYNERLEKEEKEKFDIYQEFNNLINNKNLQVAIEKYEELLINEHVFEKDTLLFINTPSLDREGFLGSPTGLLYAIGPTIKEIERDNLAVESFSKDNIFDPQSTDDLKNNLIKKLRKLKPSIVGISTTSHSYHQAIKLARIIKKYNKKIIIILGGPHPDEIDLNNMTKIGKSNNPLNIEYFDFISKGDGEYLLLELIKKIIIKSPLVADRLKKIKKEFFSDKDVFSGVKGKAELWFRYNGENIRRESCGNLIDLNKLPPLYYEYMDKSHFYDYDIFQKRHETMKGIQLMTHRGCRGGCKYCSELGQVIYRNPKDVVNEIENAIKKYKIEAFFFDDSTFNEDVEFVMKFCDLLIESGLSKKIEWGCLTRFDKIGDEKIINKMRKANCTYSYLGLEQYNTDLLYDIGKRIYEKDIDQTLDNLEKYGIRVGLSILFGIGESVQQARNTIKFLHDKIDENKIELISLSLNTYHPSSIMTRNLKKSLPGKNINNLELLLDYSCLPLYDGPPWNCFEEGLWYHPIEVTEDYGWFIINEMKDPIILSKLVRKNNVEKAIKYIEKKNIQILSDKDLEDQWKRSIKDEDSYMKLFGKQKDAAHLNCNEYKNIKLINL